MVQPENSIQDYFYLNPIFKSGTGTHRHHKKEGTKEKIRRRRRSSLKKDIENLKIFELQKILNITKERHFYSLFGLNNEQNHFYKERNNSLKIFEKNLYTSKNRFNASIQIMVFKSFALIRNESERLKRHLVGM